MPAVGKVDPACAICSQPAGQNCGCEAHALEVAIVQAEERFIRPAYMDVRSWVRRRARDYILAYFHIISEPCKDAYSEHLDQITAQCFHHYNSPPSPAHLARAEADYRRNVDNAWRLSVKRYPEVLDYFYSLVHITLPDDDDPAVKNPPLDRLGDMRHTETRRLVNVPSAPTPNFPIPALPAMQMVGAAPWTTPPASPHHGHHGHHGHYWPPRP